MTDETAVSNKICVNCGRQFDAAELICPDDGDLLVVSAPKEIEDPFIGTTLEDKYQILAIAGKGGMGVVYRGRHIGLDRIVAVKVLKTDLIADEKSYVRFQVEAVAASRLNHPNAVSVHHYGVAPSGQPFLVMDFVEGVNLAKVIADEGAIGYRRALPIFIQACNALEHAHSNDIIHRDVKTSNIILVDAEGQPDFVKIVDFGIAQLGMLSDEGLRITRTGEVFGSPAYMSPEQCTGDKVDKRTDVYAMGAVMYEALTGVPPILGKNAIDTIQRKFSEDPRPFRIARPTSSVPDAVEAVVMKALQREPRRRFQSMQELKNALDASLQGYNRAASSMSGLPALEPSEFAEVDLLQEIEKKNLSAGKLKARAKSARYLGVDKDGAPVDVEKLKTSDVPKQAPLPSLVSAALGLIVLIAFGIWYTMFAQTQSIKGIVISVGTVDRKNKNIVMRTKRGESKTFLLDSKTRLQGVPKAGRVAEVIYSVNAGKLHADKVLVPDTLK